MHARLRSSHQMWQLQRMVSVVQSCDIIFCIVGGIICAIVWCHMYSPVSIVLFNLYHVWYLFKHMVSLIVL